MGWGGRSARRRAWALLVRQGEQQPAMNLKDRWGRLDPATRKWLTDNPGCQTLPRTIAAVISKETGENIETGQHGEAAISREDQAFIRSKADTSPGAYGDR